MRLFAVISLMLFLLGPAHGQRRKKAGSVQSPETIPTAISADSMYLTVYRNGLKYGDYRVSIDALHHLYALHPDRRSYRDSLTLLYMQSGNFVQAVVLGREVLTDSPANIHITSAVAFCEEKLGRYKEALEFYEKLDKLSPNLYNAYQAASLQYRMQRFGEAMISLNRIIASQASEQEKVDITIGETNQSVTYRAAAYNLLGVVSKELGALQKSRESFENALRLEPDFILARQNLEYLNESESPEANPTGSTPAPSKPNSKKSNPTKKL